MSDKLKKTSLVDGFARTEEEEAHLDMLVHAALSNPAGVTLMAYLRSITVNHVIGMNHEPTAFAYMEGTRHTVAVMQQRLDRHMARMEREQRKHEHGLKTRAAGDNNASQ